MGGWRDRGLVGIACTAYMPMVAPVGSSTKLFGTNPISFAWPRPGHGPVCYDMATAAMAMGDIQIAARDGVIFSFLIMLPVLHINLR